MGRARSGAARSKPSDSRGRRLRRSGNHAVRLKVSRARVKSSTTNQLGARQLKRHVGRRLSDNDRVHLEHPNSRRRSAKHRLERVFKRRLGALLGAVVHLTVNLNALRFRNRIGDIQRLAVLVNHAKASLELNQRRVIVGGFAQRCRDHAAHHFGRQIGVPQLVLLTIFVFYAIHKTIDNSVDNGVHLGHSLGVERGGVLVVTESQIARKFGRSNLRDGGWVVNVNNSKQIITTISNYLVKHGVVVNRPRGIARLDPIGFAVHPTLQTVRAIDRLRGRAKLNGQRATLVAHVRLGFCRPGALLGQ